MKSPSVPLWDTHFPQMDNYPLKHQMFLFFSYRFRPNQFSVRVGEWDLSDNDNYVQEFRVVDIQAHPDFKPNGFYNDVALFILDQPVKFTE